KVAKRVDVHRTHRRARANKRIEKAIGFLNHEVPTERHRRDLPNRPHARHPNRQIRDKVPIHDVDVDEVSPPTFRGRDLLAKDREVRREDGWSDAHRHRLTSGEMGSPGAIWNPACGFCRRTMPAGTPGYG